MAILIEKDFNLEVEEVIDQIPTEDLLVELKERNVLGKLIEVDYLYDEIVRKGRSYEEVVQEAFKADGKYVF